MPNISLAIMELAAAQYQIDKLLKKDFAPWEGSVHWNVLVVHLDNCWVKAERGCQDIKNKFKPWQGRYKHQIKNDELLTFVYQARHAGIHSLQEVVKPEIIRALPKSLMPDIDLRTVRGIKIPKEKMEYFEKNLRLQKFDNEGRSYFPPKTHLGKIIREPKNPIAVGSLAIAYYWNFLNDISNEFCQGIYANDLKEIFNRYWIGNVGYANGKKITIPFAVDSNFKFK